MPSVDKAAFGFELATGRWSRRRLVYQRQPWPAIWATVAFQTRRFGLLAAGYQIGPAIKLESRRRRRFRLVLSGIFVNDWADLQGGCKNMNELAASDRRSSIVEATRAACL